MPRGRDRISDARRTGWCRHVAPVSAAVRAPPRALYRIAEREHHASFRTPPESIRGFRTRVLGPSQGKSLNPWVESLPPG